jgi:hypothetical protein
VEKPCRTRRATDDNTIRRMRFAWWITKATDTHSEYVILIAFPRQQWLCERASMLRLYVTLPLVLEYKKWNQNIRYNHSSLQDSTQPVQVNY